MSPSTIKLNPNLANCIVKLDPSLNSIFIDTLNELLQLSTEYFKFCRANSVYSSTEFLLFYYDFASFCESISKHDTPILLKDLVSFHNSLSLMFTNVLYARHGLFVSLEVSFLGLKNTWSSFISDQIIAFSNELAQSNTAKC